jgi:aryl-alcohol dehydrogenase-like predicted oxidoreductase
LNLEKFATAQLYYSLVGRGLETDWLSFAEYHNMGILVWSPLAGGFLSAKYEKGKKPQSGTRFSEAGQFVTFDREWGFRIVDEVKKVAKRHGVSPAQVSIGWLLSRPMISSVIIAGRKIEHLKDNIEAVNLKLTDEDFAQLDEVSNPGTPYPKWMVLQLDQAEDPRPKILEPERFKNGGPWKDLRGTTWEG